MAGRETRSKRLRSDDVAAATESHKRRRQSSGTQLRSRARASAADPASSLRSSKTDSSSRRTDGQEQRGCASAGAGWGKRQKSRANVPAPAPVASNINDLPEDIMLIIFKDLQLHRFQAAAGELTILKRRWKCLSPVAFPTLYMHHKPFVAPLSACVVVHRPQW